MFNMHLTCYVSKKIDNEVILEKLPENALSNINIYLLCIQLKLEKLTKPIFTSFFYRKVSIEITVELLFS